MSVDDVAGNGYSRCCSPRHRMPVNQRGYESTMSELHLASLGRWAWQVMLARLAMPSTTETTTRGRSSWRAVSARPCLESLTSALKCSPLSHVEPSN